MSNALILVTHSTLPFVGVGKIGLGQHGQVP
jgi:hypothetical protein